MSKFVPAIRSLLALLVFALILGSVQTQAQSDCSLNFGPGAALQPVLNNAPEGAVICLARGSYFGPLLISKSVTLRGAPADAQGKLGTLFQAFQASQPNQPSRPILIVSGPNEMTVNLENLSIADSKDSVGLAIAHGKTIVNLRNSEIVRQGNNGIVIDGAVKLNIINSRIADNLVYGILMLGSAEVTLTDSIVSGHKQGGVIAFEAAHLILNNSQLTKNAPYGAAITDSASATVRQSVISENAEFGFSVNELGSALIEDSRVIDNRRIGLIATGNAELRVHRTLVSNQGEFGIIANDTTGLFIAGSVISRNRQIGILVQHSAQLQMSDTQVMDNVQWDTASQRRSSVGIFLNNTAIATLSNTTITGNGFYGLALFEAAQAEIKSSEIANNGADPLCANVQAVCTGVLLRAKPQLKLTDTKITNNTDWGIAALLKKCGFTEDAYDGLVNLEGVNTFQGNNQSGRHQGENCLP